MVLINVILFALGLILLVMGSDFFVKSAASLSRKLGVSEFIIGLTLVALGTSIPELSSAIFASFKKESGLIIGNIVGANIANIGLIMGIAAAIFIIKTKKEMLKRDGYIMLFVSALLYLFILDGVISRIEALLLLLLYLTYILFLYEVQQRLKGKYQFKEFIDYFFKFKYILTLKSGLISGVRIKDKNLKLTDFKEIMKLFIEGIIKDSLILIISGFAIIFGAKYFVNGAIFFANLFNVPQTVIGVSLVSLGTTLPELSVTFIAAKKGYGDIAIGNVIGSNITNILLVLGIAALIHPIPIINFTLYYAAPFMMLISILLLFFLRRYRNTTRIEGAILLILYLIFLSSIFFIKPLF